MATREIQNLEKTTKIVRTAEATCTVGYLVKDGNADGEAQNCGAAEAGFGVCIATGGNPEVTAGAAGDVVTVALLDGGIIPVKVGTGGATRGAFAQMVADGFTDAAPAGAGTTLTFVAGVFAQSGSAGDIVGIYPQPHYLTE